MALGILRLWVSARNWVLGTVWLVASVGSRLWLHISPGCARTAVSGQQADGTQQGLMVAGPLRHGVETPYGCGRQRHRAVQGARPRALPQWHCSRRSCASVSSLRLHLRTAIKNELRRRECGYLRASSHGRDGLVSVRSESRCREWISQHLWPWRKSCPMPHMDVCNSEPPNKLWIRLSLRETPSRW